MDGRQPGERYAEGNISPRVIGGGSIMVCGAINFEIRTELVGCSRTSLNVVSSTLVISLKNHVLPFAPFIGENLLLLRDNARPHTARVVNEYLNETKISLLNCPPKFPDLNPIEHY